MIDRPHVVVITGLSGAGRSQSANVLEDIGYFVVDNLPPSLILEVVQDRRVDEDEKGGKLAVVVDSRGGLSFEDLEGALRGLEVAGILTTVVFLDADDQSLVDRYEELRRPHPVKAATLSESIATERAALEGLRGSADVIIDTTDRNVHELKRLLEDAFAGGRPTRPMRITVVSFGFKKGVPRVLDALFDVRFLPNPHWDPDLRPKTGLDEDVRNFVLDDQDAAEFFKHVTGMLDFLLPRYISEGKAYFTIGVGCTGGRHRSVVIADEIGEWLQDRGLDVTVEHRDIDP